MNLDQLKHAIRAACDISDDNELYVFGSQAILAQFPDADPLLTRSIEVDVAPKNKSKMVDKIDGALGQGSPFHSEHGFYVHGVSIETAVLPEGWKDRTNTVSDYMDVDKKGYCIEAHDLAVSKLIAFRDKDREFVRKLIVENLIEIEILSERLQMTTTNDELLQRAENWTKGIAKEL